MILLPAFKLWQPRVWFLFLTPFISCNNLGKSLNDLYFNVSVNGMMGMSGLDLSTLHFGLVVPMQKVSLSYVLYTLELQERRSYGSWPLVGALSAFPFFSWVLPKRKQQKKVPIYFIKASRSFFVWLVKKEDSLQLMLSSMC